MLKKFLAWLDAPRQKPWKLVGRGKFATVITDDNNKKMHHTAMFYMTESGKRRVEYVTMDNWFMERHPYHHDCEVWEKGGPFPNGFQPQEDVLGEMLTRMIDARILGKEQ